MDKEVVGKAVLAATMVFAGVALVWTARATASGRLGRNPIAGVRTAVTMADDEAWLTAHQAARTPTEVAGWCAVVFGVAAALVPGMPLAASIAGIGAVVMLVLVLVGARRGVRAVKAGVDEHPSPEHGG